MSYIKKSTLTLPHSLEEIQHIRDETFMQSNPLIEAIFIQPFKELELKVLCLISKQINEKKYVSLNRSLEDMMKESIRVTVTKRRFCQALKTNPSNFYSQIKKLSEELTNKKICIQELQNKNHFATFVLFPAVVCKDNQVTFYISEVLRPYLHHLKENFTILSLEQISNMKSSYAIKVFQLLKQYESIGKRIFRVEEFKSILGISNLYVNNFNDFKKDVLFTIQKHINEHTDLRVTFKVKKEGRKVSQIIFEIGSKQNQFTLAIKTFTREFDIILRQKISYGGYHQILQKYWKDTKKNIEKNKVIFDLWLKKRVVNYNASSIETLLLSELTFSDSYHDIPEWYIEFLQNSFEIFWTSVKV
jgi:plasmid replication initiation protein